MGELIHPISEHVEGRLLLGNYAPRLNAIGLSYVPSVSSSNISEIYPQSRNLDDKAIQQGLAKGTLVGILGLAAENGIPSDLLGHKTTRRNLLKGAFAGAAGLGAGTVFSHTRNEASAAEALDSEENKDTFVFSNEVIELMKAPFEKQVEYASTVVKAFEGLEWNKLSKLVAYHGKLADHMLGDHQLPPRLVRDILAARTGQEFAFTIAEKTGLENQFPNIGVVSDYGPIEDFEKYAFSGFVDSVLLAITNHVVHDKRMNADGDLEDVDILVQVGHFGSVAGRERKGRIRWAGTLGYSAIDPITDPTIHSPNRTWVDAHPDVEGENKMMFSVDGMPPSHPYQTLINSLYGNRWKTVYTGSWGDSLIIADQHYEEGSQQLRSPLRQYKNTIMYANDKTNKNSFDWITWKTGYAAGNSAKQQWGAWSFPENNPVMQEIGQVFPEVYDKTSEPEMLDPDYFLDPQREVVTFEELAQIPTVVPWRLAQSGKSIFEGSNIPTQIPL